MFNSISGIITGKFPKQLLIENNGIEWDICVPDSNLDMFGTVGSEARVLRGFSILMFLWRCMVLRRQKSVRCFLIC